MLKDSKREELESRLKQVFSDYRELAGGKNYRYHHLVSARKYALKLMREAEADIDEGVVEIAALFHDIGRSDDIEDGYLDPQETHEGHAETGEEIVAEHIQDLVTSSQLEKIETIIGNHHSEPETKEGEIVQDSDLLFKYGIHNLWRTIHYASEKDRNLPKTLDYLKETGIPDLEERLANFHLDRSREVANERLYDLKKAVRKMEIEIEGEDI